MTPTAVLAAVLTVLFAYAIVENLMTIAGRSRALRAAVLAFATLTGFIFPWLVLDALFGILAPVRSDD